MLTNVSWYAGVSKHDIETSATTTASLWFARVLGNSTRIRGLNIPIALSASGNMVSGAIGAARMIRECGRQGVLPFTDFWASTRPFGTPIGPYVFKWAITALVILAVPSGDAFNCEFWASYLRRSANSRQTLKHLWNSPSLLSGS